MEPEIEGLLRHRLGNFPILAELTIEVAPRGGNGKGAGPWEDVEEGFLLDGVYVYRTWIPVAEAVELSLPVLPHLAVASPSWGNLALPWTEGALYLFSARG